MVRIISQNFSPPRSRHSSGETDLDLAERTITKLALSTLGRKRIDLPEYESSSDSFWDSEFDCDHNDEKFSEAESERADINGNDPKEKSDAQTKRKQRRRERNKLSAQAYRQRRRHQSVKEKQDLMSLETENKRLHKLVESLEKETEQAKQYLRGMLVPMPDILSPVGEEASPDCLENQFCGAEAAAAAEPNFPRGLPNGNQPSLPQATIPESPHPHAPTHSIQTVEESSPQQLLLKNIGNNNPTDNQFSMRASPDITPRQSPVVNAPSGVPLQPRILINAPTFITTPISTNENLNVSGATAAGPTYYAVPIVEQPTQCFPPANLNALQNANQGLTHLISPEANKNSASNWVGQTTTVIGATTSQVLGATWNGSNAAISPMNVNGNTLISIVKMEMCNNSNANFSNSHNNGNLGNANTILNDNNGNQNSCNTMTMRAVNPQLVSFKINLNHATGLHPLPAAVEDVKSQGSGLTSLTRPSGSSAISDQAVAMHVQ